MKSPDDVLMIQFLQQTDLTQSRAWHTLTTIPPQRHTVVTVHYKSHNL